MLKKQLLLSKHKTIDTPKIVNIFILNAVSTINSSDLQKKVVQHFAPSMFLL